jgi:glyoxylase-like metal-dependent hydrolase (beta-lactamase superfamily II)
MTRIHPAVCAVLTLLAACGPRDFSDNKPVANSTVVTLTTSAPVVATAAQTATWCAQLPRAANTALPIVRTRSDWFHVHQAAPGVFALIESDQFQEAISYLIVGNTQALMFDTGIGVVAIRPVVEQLTTLPVTVVNSHSHYDHVGGNHEFARVLSMDTPFTRLKMAGRPHEGLASEVAATSFCHGAPPGFDLASFRSQPWKSSGVIRDGTRIDLGGRVVEIVGAPGHTPDGIALLDRANGLLFTGDNFYDSTIWLYAHETSLDDYVASMTKLVALAPRLKQLLPAHNTANVDPARLATVLAAMQKLRTGTFTPLSDERGELTYNVDGVLFLTSKEALAHR